MENVFLSFAWKSNSSSYEKVCKMACFETEDEGATKIAEYVFPFFLLFFSFTTESCSRTGWGHGGKDTLDSQSLSQSLFRRTICTVI